MMQFGVFLLTSSDDSSGGFGCVDLLARIVHWSSLAPDDGFLLAERMEGQWINFLLDRLP